MARPAKKPTRTKATKRPAWEEKLLKDARAERRAKKKKPFIKRALGRKPSTSSKPKKRLIWRLVKGTTKGTAKFTAKQTGKAWKKGSTKVNNWWQNRDFENGYIPEPGEIPHSRSARGATIVGDKKFNTPAAAMAYSEKVGASEPEVKLADRSRTVVRISRWGTVRVAPATTPKPPPKKKRRPEAGPSKTEALIKAHRAKIDTIGRVAVAENEVAKRVKKAFQELFDHKPRKLSGMEELALGMEQAEAYAAEVIESYRLFLIQKSFDPANLMPLVKVQECHERAALEWTKHIVVIKEELAAEIAAAKRRREGAAETVPDDETLAG